MALAGASLTGFDVVNVGTDAHYTILELIDEIFLRTKWKPREIEKQLDKPVGVNSRAADVTKCKERLGWTPSYSLRDGVGRTVDWYLASPESKNIEALERRLMERA
jgi:nucleoside-diphosphate-sugar epimerase